MRNLYVVTSNSVFYSTFKYHLQSVPSFFVCKLYPDNFTGNLYVHLCNSLPLCILCLMHVCSRIKLNSIITF